MAAPSEITVRNLSGSWKSNARLTDDPTAAMELQGVSWLVRKVIARAEINLAITQTTDASTGVSHIATVQKTLGRVMEADFVLDWQERGQVHAVFGQQDVKSRFCDVEQIEETFLREGWEPGLQEVVEVIVEGSGCTAWQVWGFEVIDGERHHVRRSLVAKGEKQQMIKMVYDWDEPKEV
ncbi:uncharacterized protein BCR38DRAFT_426986 [Pseudomassariella vexata]|uniref:LCCL domain-containing protein n=1 Tax=Pseudomassariella vexata TaxID=1141098 RepID=A0A1Y2E7K5_9PEZI|nr:uncharacterized protein BCR38DRAFT_426986 [Pseudomassariella vexata]ORY67417.1 hypothetical protein BCR38DRAFT_426986 [Pseudomassariella vexata]